MATVQTSIRLDKKRKANNDKIYKEFGTTRSNFYNMIEAYIEQNQRIPLVLDVERVYNASTLAAIEEADAIAAGMTEGEGFSGSTSEFLEGIIKNG